MRRSKFRRSRGALRRVLPLNAAPRNITLATSTEFHSVFARCARHRLARGKKAEKGRERGRRVSNEVEIPAHAAAAFAGNRGEARSRGIGELPAGRAMEGSITVPETPPATGIRAEIPPNRTLDSADRPRATWIRFARENV